MGASRRQIAAFAVGFSLLLVLGAHLVGALLAALLAYTLFTALDARLRRRLRPRIAAVLALLLVILSIALIGVLTAEWVRAGWIDHGGLVGLLDQLATTLDRLHSTLPPWLSQRVPDSVEELQRMAARWLQSNARDLQLWGQMALRLSAHLVIGVAIGLLCAVERSPGGGGRCPPELAAALQDLPAAFVDVAGAQVKIAGINTALTGIFVLLVLPMLGQALPLRYGLVVLTFVTGLVPVVGNLVGNAALVLAATAVSPGLALVMLVFLVAIHKLEYVLNAHFVGRTTQVPAWVLLSAMVMCEAFFGLGGLVAAPVACAWVLRQWMADSVGVCAKTRS